MERDVMVCLAGAEAQKIFTGRSDRYGASHDYQNARSLLNYYTPMEGEQIGPFSFRESAEFTAHFKALRLKTLRVLTRPHTWAKVKGLAERLLAHKTLSGPEAVAAMLAGQNREFPLPPSETGT